MDSIGKFSASLVQGTQETTLALANANFDFSLIKIEAPVEYRALGAHLSTARRQTAEEGTIHVTARKLAALFEASTLR